MGFPKDTVEPDVKYTYPSERDYFDTSTSTLANGQVTDTAKSGADYGVTDPEVTKPIVDESGGA